MNNYIEKWNYTDVTTRIKALRKKGKMTIYLLRKWRTWLHTLH